MALAVRRTLMSSWRRLTMRPVWQAVSMAMLSAAIAVAAVASTIEPTLADSLKGSDLVLIAKAIGLVFVAAMGIFGLEARVGKRIVVPTALIVVRDQLEKHLTTDHAAILKKLDELIDEMRANREALESKLQADRDRSAENLQHVVDRISRLEGAHNEQHGGGKR